MNILRIWAVHFGHALLWLGRLLGQVVGILLTNLAHGLGHLLRQTIPYIVGGGMVWGLWVYRPQLFEHILTLAIMVVGLGWFAKSVIFPRKKGK